LRGIRPIRFEKKNDSQVPTEHHRNVHMLDCDEVLTDVGIVTLISDNVVSREFSQ